MHALAALMLSTLLLLDQTSGFSGGSRRCVYRRLPSTGSVPLMYDPAKVEDPRQLALRATARDYAGQIRTVAKKAFGRVKGEPRERGFAELREFTDPSALKPMWDVLAGEKPDVVLFALDHFKSGGDEGQAALAYAAITSSDSAARHEALSRISTPPVESVLREIDSGLRDSRHAVVNSAGIVAGHLGALPAIPLLIFAQASEDLVEQKGDLAWIVIGTQTSYVANLIPVVGGNSGAFQPVIGTVNEGTLLRVMDAIAITYRIDVHNALVAMTTSEWGQPTGQMGYDMREWSRWYDQVFVPFKQEQVRLAKLAEEAAAQPPVGAKP